MNLGRLAFWGKPEPVSDLPKDPNVLLRLEVWSDFKRAHLAFLQTLNARTFGHSSTMALIKTAMLAAYEIDRMRGTYKDNAPDLVIGPAMTKALSACSQAYRQVTDKTFDDSALSGLTTKVDFDVIQNLITMTKSPIKSGDGELSENLAINGRDDIERVTRHTQDIAKLHATLGEYFSDMDRWTTPPTP